MVVLKKQNAYSLVEVLVASIILSIIMTICVLTFINLTKASTKNQENRLQQELNKQIYFYIHIGQDTFVLRDSTLNNWKIINPLKEQKHITFKGFDYKKNILTRNYSHD